MIKIPTIFLRDTSRKKPVITPEWNPDCLWVRDGEGMPTRKYDGTACLIRGGVLYRRLAWDAKHGLPPVGWLHHSFDPMMVSGHGWTLVGDGPDDWAHRQLADLARKMPDGTYELCGPKINGNPEKLEDLRLLRHGDYPLSAPRTFEGLREYLKPFDMEGIVFHHPDGRMAKIKRRDFGLPWGK